MSAQNRYFELMDDFHIPGRWYVKGPLDDQGRELIPYQFRRGEILRWDAPLFLPVRHQGLALDFTQTGLGFIVVSSRFVSICERLGIQNEVQFVPARVEGHSEPYFVLNPLRIVKCVDEARSEEFSVYEPGYDDPEKVGHYRMLFGLKIDPEKVGDASIFHPWGWTVVLIVSERVKQAIEEEGLIRPQFTEV
ncbi:imm11 family protein [Archangium sp.]|uniref:imm11 family protein n=1 Tax=Archangium sp. TaxID=1872627 RepID=UPI00389AFD4D